MPIYLPTSKSTKPRGVEKLVDPALSDNVIDMFGLSRDPEADIRNTIVQEHEHGQYTGIGGLPCSRITITRAVTENIFLTTDHTIIPSAWLLDTPAPQPG